MDRNQIYRIAKCRIDDTEHMTMRPRIAVAVGNKVYGYDLFYNKDRIYEDLKFLADIWFDLLPEEDMSIGQKQHEIAQYLVGKRKANEFFELMNKLFLER